MKKAILIQALDNNLFLLQVEEWSGVITQEAHPATEIPKRLKKLLNELETSAQIGISLDEPAPIKEGDSPEDPEDDL